MYVIVSGKASVKLHVAGRPQEIATLGPGDIVGEISLLTGATRNATVTAVKPVRALEIGKPALEELLAKNPGLVERFAHVVEQRCAEISRITAGALRWHQETATREELIARMMAHYYG
jgi:CRP-like cAMP-binding protein